MIRRLVAAVLLVSGGATGVTTADATAAKETEIVSVTVSGDVLTHTSLWRSAQKTDKTYDFRPNLVGLSPVLDGDVDICHLETPLLDTEPATYPLFSTPLQLADGLKSAGFEGCSTASNHSLDRGMLGIASTLRALERSGLRHSGMRSDAREPGWAVYTTAGGTRVAHLSYTFSTNGIPLPRNAPWSVNMIDKERIIKAATVAGRSSDLVVVSLHWGTEYQERPNSMQTSIARALAASGEIDLIAGHHAHVLQKAELIFGVPVLYGLGNLWSGQGPWSDKPLGDLAAVAELRFKIDGTSKPIFVGGTHYPTVVNPRGWKVTTADRAVFSRGCAATRRAQSLLGTVLTAARGVSC